MISLLLLLAADPDIHERPGLEAIYADRQEALVAWAKRWIPGKPVPCPCGSEDGAPHVVLGGLPALEVHCKDFPIKPSEAQRVLARYKRTLPPGEPRAFHRLMGVIGDEYHFAVPFKQGLVLAGYRINVVTGAVRLVSREEAETAYNGRFKKGYITRAEYRYIKYVEWAQ
jgi:hypothetical protein